MISMAQYKTAVIPLLTHWSYFSLAQNPRSMSACKVHTQPKDEYTRYQYIYTHFHIQLDMSTARWRLKSPQSLYGTSTHPTMVTHRSWSWSWMIDSHPFRSMSISHHQSDNNSWDTAILKFDLEKSKVKVMGDVKSQGHIVHPVSNQCNSLSFHINRTNRSWDMSNRVFDLEKTYPKFSKKIWQNRASNRIPPKSNQVMTMTREI